MKQLLVTCVALMSFVVTSGAYASCSRQDATGTWEINVTGNAIWTHCEVRFRVDSTVNVDETNCTEYDFAGNPTPLGAFLSGTIDSVTKSCRVTITLIDAGEGVNTLTGRLTRDGEVIQGRWVTINFSAPFTAVKFN